ncbi:MAG: hypothetical protein NZ602_09890, partial [Thermoguttaceae bacterium]|nr:hypothetical protein [Thermoguttaceae bacterium]
MLRIVLVLLAATDGLGNHLMPIVEVVEGLSWLHLETFVQDVPERKNAGFQSTLSEDRLSNPLLVRLIEEGIPADEQGKVRVRLPKPTMPDSLSEAEQARILAQVAKPRPLEEFVRNTVVAPFAMQIVDVPLPETPDPIRRVDVWYVAYGQLEQLFSEQFLEQLLHQTTAHRHSRYPVARHILSAEELSDRNLVLPPDTPTSKERYLFTAVAMFDRVFLRTTRYIVINRSEESLVLAAAVAPAFQQDKQYPNQWQSIQVDEQGRFTLGPPKAYWTSGSYTKIT